MTPYTVVWLEDALNGLAAIWIAASNRTSITIDAAEVDFQLSKDADSKGTASHEGLRTLRSGSIQVLFSVRPLDRIVEVAQVKPATLRFNPERT